MNPVLARESELGAVESTPAETPKKIVVVGGGPPDSKSLASQTLRGHDVTVFEAARNIGGALRFAALLYEPNLRLLRWYEHEMRRLAVDVRTATTATPEAVAALSPDHVVVATGAARTADAARSRPPTSSTATTSASCSPVLALPGRREASVAGSSRARHRSSVGLIDDPGILAKLTEQYMPVGKRVVIIGGGLVGAELAEFLMERDRKVTVLEEGDKLALEMAHPRRWRVLGDLRDHGVALVTGARDIEIGADASPGRPTKVTQGRLPTS